MTSSHETRFIKKWKTPYLHTMRRTEVERAVVLSACSGYSSCSYGFGRR